MKNIGTKNKWMTLLMGLIAATSHSAGHAADLPIYECVYVVTPKNGASVRTIGHVVTKEIQHPKGDGVEDINAVNRVLGLPFTVGGGGDWPDARVYGSYSAFGGNPSLCLFLDHDWKCGQVDEKLIWFSKLGDARSSFKRATLSCYPLEAKNQEQSQ